MPDSTASIFSRNTIMPDRVIRIDEDQYGSSNQGAVTTTVGSAVATTAATAVAPYGFSEAQANAIVANANALRVDVLALNTLLTALRTSLVAADIIKGGA